MQDIIETLDLDAALTERPEMGRQSAGGGTDQCGNRNVEGAEADAHGTQRGAGLLIERFQLFGDFCAIEHAERLSDLKRDAAGYACQVFGGFELEQGAEELFDMGFEPEINARLDEVARRGGEMVIGEDAQARLQNFFTGDEAGDHFAIKP